MSPKNTPATQASDIDKIASSQTDRKTVTMEAIKEASRGNLKSFATIEDLITDLNADDWTD